MLILSWNVAGLTTTLQRINADYSVGTENKESKSMPSSSKGATFLANYFKLHQADIICLQEHKISLSSIKNRNEPFSCCTSTPGYESFWSCCVDPTKRGFNGVCTFAKQGTTILADNSILGDKDLDDQGRCIMTDHGAFVLFNVYVPALGGQSLSYKMRFLKALRRAMKTKRDVEGRHVILVGDLNIAHTKEDVLWCSRMVDIDQIITEVSDSNAGSDIPPWKLDVYHHWDNIASALETKRVSTLVW